jgi:hypothetical protein
MYSWTAVRSFVKTSKRCFDLELRRKIGRNVTGWYGAVTRNADIQKMSGSTFHISVGGIVDLRNFIDELYCAL